MKKVIKVPKIVNQPSHDGKDTNSDKSKFYKDTIAAFQNPMPQWNEPIYSQEQRCGFEGPAENPSEMRPNNKRINHSNTGLGELSTFIHLDDTSMNPETRNSLGGGNQYYYHNDTPSFGYNPSIVTKDDSYQNIYARSNTAKFKIPQTPQFSNPRNFFEGVHENPPNNYNYQNFESKPIAYSPFSANEGSPFSTLPQPLAQSSSKPPPLDYNNPPKPTYPINNASAGYENTLLPMHNPSVPPPLSINPNSKNPAYPPNSQMQHYPSILEHPYQTSNNPPPYLPNTNMNIQPVYEQIKPPPLVIPPQASSNFAPANLVQIPPPPLNSGFGNQYPAPQNNQFRPPPNIPNLVSNPQLVNNKKPPPLNFTAAQNTNYSIVNPSTDYSLPCTSQGSNDINNQMLPINISNTKDRVANQPVEIPPPPLNITGAYKPLPANFSTVNINSNAFMPPPPTISLSPIQIKDFFTVLKESTCLVCNQSNPNFLSSCKHLYHIKCIDKLKSSKCVKCSEAIKSDYLDIPSNNNCHNCLSAFNLFPCNNCNKKSCISCIMLRNLQSCCGNIEKNKVKLYQQCPGCFYDRSICDLVLNTCITHNFLCKKCWNLSARIGKCILGCAIETMRFPDIIRCPECFKFEIKYFGEYLCPDGSCEDCEKCMSKRFLAIPKCIPYCTCTEPMIKKNVEDLWT